MDDKEVKKYVDKERVILLKKYSKFFWDMFHLNNSLKKAIVENNKYSIGIRLNKMNMLVKNMHKFVLSRNDVNKKKNNSENSINDLIYKDEY